MRTQQEVVYAFTPTSKLSESDKMANLHLQKLFIDAATELIRLVPESADRTSALRKLLECKLMAVHALTHPPKAVKPTKELEDAEPKKL